MNISMISLPGKVTIKGGIKNIELLKYQDGLQTSFKFHSIESRSLASELQSHVLIVIKEKGVF